MPASHHSLSLTPLRVLACLALLSVVAAGIAITVILSQSTNPMFSIRREVIVPDLSGMDWQQAQVEQSAAQLSIVWDTRYSAQAEGIVIAQKPTAGSTVKQGHKLILSVSKGPSTITVPDLKSQNRSDAIQTLRDAGFTVSVDYIRNDPTLQADTVILQSPAAGTALEAGDCITLTVARAVPDPFRQVPSLLGMSVAEARRRLAIVELPFKIHRSDFKPNPQCKKFLGIGLPLALQEFLTQLSFLALCAFVNRLGLEASSGYGVACKIVNFAMLIPSSLMQSMASFVSQNVGAGNKKRAEQSMFTGIGIGLVFGCAVFALVWCKGDVLSGLFTADAAVIANGYAYLKGFAPETIATAILFSMVGYFNGNDKTLWVMVQGLVQTLLVRLPMAYIMSIQPNASLTMIGLSAPTSTAVGILLNICFFLWLKRYENQTSA